MQSQYLDVFSAHVVPCTVCERWTGAWRRCPVCGRQLELNAWLCAGGTGSRWNDLSVHQVGGSKALPAFPGATAASAVVQGADYAFYVDTAGRLVRVNLSDNPYQPEMVQDGIPVPATLAISYPWLVLLSDGAVRWRRLGVDGGDWFQRDISGGAVVGHAAVAADRKTVWWCTRSAEGDAALHRWHPAGTRRQLEYQSFDFPQGTTEITSPACDPSGFGVWCGARDASGQWWLGGAQANGQIDAAVFVPSVDGLSAPRITATGEIQAIFWRDSHPSLLTAGLAEMAPGGTESPIPAAIQAPAELDRFGWPHALQIPPEIALRRVALLEGRWACLALSPPLY